MTPSQKVSELTPLQIVVILQSLVSVQRIEDFLAEDEGRSMPIKSGDRR